MNYDTNPSYQMGHTMGLVFVCVALLAGALKCWSISRRPTTNTKCALSLMLFLLAFFIGGTGGQLMKRTDLSPVSAVGVGLMGLVMLGLLVTAIVLAILGLVEYSRQRETYLQGRAQAIWTLSLGGLMTVLFITGFVRGVSRAHSLHYAGQSRPGTVSTFDDLNFRFRIPNLPWVAIDATKLNKASKITLTRRVPEAYFFIIPEKIGAGMNLTTERLAEIGQANMQASIGSSHVLSEAPLNINGLKGLAIETEVQMGSYQLHYRHWYCATNGYAYQLVGYSRSEDWQPVSAELQEIFTRFEVLDPNRIASSPGSFTTNYESPRHGYSIILTNSDWHAFPALDERSPHAEFGASQGDSCFVMIPAHLDGETPDLDSLTAAFLSLFEIRYPNENLTNRHLLAEGGREGVQYDLSREVAGQDFHYRFKILGGNGEGYLIAAWTQRRAADEESLFTDVFNRIKFGGSPGGFRLLSPETGRTDREQKTDGYILNQAGLYHYNLEEYEKALPYFCAAARANPRESLYVLNALHSWQYLERPKEALAFLAKQPDTLLALPAIRASQAYFQMQASLTEEAITNYAGLFAGGYRDDAHLGEYVKLLLNQKKYDLALAELQKYLKSEDSIAARLLEAQIYRGKQDYAQSISLLKQLHEKVPANSQVTGALADDLIQAKQYSEALETSHELVRSNENSAYAHYLEGESEVGLKWYREAKVAFAAAAKLAPANKDIRAYLDYVSGLLGEGDNTALTDPIEPVALPAGLTNAPEATGPDASAKNCGAYYARRAVAAAWIPGKEFKTTEYMLVRILDTAGTAAFSTVQIAFDPLGEQVYVNEVRVMDPAGKTVSTGDMANYYVLDDRSSLLASQQKILNIAVPGLQPGCQLAVTFTRRQFVQPGEFPLFEHSFASAFPVQESLFFLAGGAKGLKYRASPALEPEKFPEGLCWRVADPKIVRWEPLQPPAASFLPVLWIADAGAQWSTVVSNYLAAVDDRLKPDAAVQEQARKLVENLDTSEAKIARLAGYVQSNLTYKGIEFGRRARIPNRPADIARNQYGDCKDHAVLLQQMLAAAGVPAQLALVSHRGPIQKDLPSLDQFDHMVVHLSKGPGERFLDCTSKGADVAHSIPPGVAGQEALILDASNPHFATIPDYGENDSSISVQQHFSLTNQTDLLVEETLTLTGVHAASLRDYLSRIPETSYRTMVQNQLNMTDAEITDIKIESLRQPGTPLRLHFAYSFKKRFQASNDRLLGMFQAGFARLYLAADPSANRLTPFEITLPFTFEDSASFDIPRGYHAEEAEASSLKLDPRFATGQGSIRVEGNQIKLAAKFRQLTGKFNASDYPAYRETMAQALSCLEREIVLKPDTR